MQIKNFTTMIPTGVAFAASGLVGNCIGMNQVERAKQYAQVCIIFSCVVTAIMLSTFGLNASLIAGLFTDDQEIIEATTNCFWSLFLYIFASTIKGV